MARPEAKADPARRTHESLVRATLELIAERGWSGATTRAIAGVAGVSEVTLFRHFPTKQDLLTRAIATAAAEFARAVREPSGDLEEDLWRLAEGYVSFVDAHPRLVARLLPEIGAGGEAAELLASEQRQLGLRIAALFAHYQATGELRAEPPADAVRAFVGPLLARAMLHHVLPLAPFDSSAHIRLFLRGHGRTGSRRTRRPADDIE